MKRLIWTTSRLAGKLGLPGIAGVILVTASIAGYLSITFWENSRLQELTREEVQERNRLKMSRLNPQSDDRSPGAQLHAFYDFFPVRQDAPKLFNTIYNAAHDVPISLSQGEYKFDPGKSGHLGVYRVNLPVKGSYPQIRKFIVKVMNALPSAALEEISFRREAVSRSDLDAKIRFSIYLSANK